jgi:hypothetical protein
MFHQSTRDPNHFTFVMMHVLASTRVALGGNCEEVNSLQIIRRFFVVKSSVVLMMATTALILATTAVTDACMDNAHMSPTSFPAMKCFLYRPKRKAKGQ